MIDKAKEVIDKFKEKLIEHSKLMD